MKTRLHKTKENIAMFPIILDGSYARINSAVVNIQTPNSSITCRNFMCNLRIPIFTKNQTLQCCFSSKYSQLLFVYQHGNINPISLVT